MTLPHGYDSSFEFDMALQAPVFYMMQRGIRIDLDKRRELAGEYRAKWADLQEKLDYIAGGSLNVNSPKQMKEFLYDELRLPVRRTGGRPTVNEDALRALAALCKKEMKARKTDSARMRWTRGFITVMLTLKIRALRKRLSSYLDAKVDSDGRMRTTLSVGGTETGRFSSSKTLWGTGCNLQTIPRELRIMFIPDEGFELAEFDLNRGESWVYSHLSGDPEMMRIHTQRGDFHAETACAISSLFGRHINSEEWKDFYDEDPEKGYRLRFLGKKCNHAFAYRMGAYRAAEVVNESADDTGITVVVAQTKQMQQLWLQKYFMIPQWWASIEKELNRSRTLTTPFGRTRQFFERWGDSLFKEATAYVPQSTSVDYLNAGMLRVFHNGVKQNRWGLELLHQNHDSILVQYRHTHRDEVMPFVIREIEREFEINGRALTIPVEAQYGSSWGSLTEWKG